MATTGFDSARLARAGVLCEEAVGRGELEGASLFVARGGEVALNRAWGKVRYRLDPDGPDGLPASTEPRPVTPETVWLVASVTKPIVCAGVCLLLERGLVGLDDPVRRFFPEMTGEDRREMTLRHLMTHSSGLPDMLPENVELRRSHAPIAEYVRRVCGTPLRFRPGADVSYQSMGILLLGALIERLTNMPCRRFLAREFFEPMGMTTTELGWSAALQGRAAVARLDGGTAPSLWDWNSRYWRDFGAPWGGLFASAPEIGRFLMMLGNGGVWRDRHYLGRATVQEMTRNQTADLPNLPDAVRRRSTWGLGWRVAAGRESDYLGDLTGRRAFGHAGATGTGVWHDPDSGVTFVLFTNQPGCGRFIGLVSNAVAAAAL